METMNGYSPCFIALSSRELVSASFENPLAPDGVEEFLEHEPALAVRNDLAPALALDDLNLIAGLEHADGRRAIVRIAAKPHAAGDRGETRRR